VVLLVVVFSVVAPYATSTMGSAFWLSRAHFVTGDKELLDELNPLSITASSLLKLILDDLDAG
jgi:hypothetical protein